MTDNQIYIITNKSKFIPVSGYLYLKVVFYKRHKFSQ